MNCRSSNRICLFPHCLYHALRTAPDATNVSKWMLLSQSGAKSAIKGWIYLNRLTFLGTPSISHQRKSNDPTTRTTLALFIESSPLPNLKQ